MTHLGKGEDTQGFCGNTQLVVGHFEAFVGDAALERGELLTGDEGLEGKVCECWWRSQLTQNKLPRIDAMVNADSAMWMESW